MQHGRLRIRDASPELVKMVSFRAAASEKRLLVREANRQNKSLSLLISEQLEPFLEQLRAREVADVGEGAPDASEDQDQDPIDSPA